MMAAGTSVLPAQEPPGTVRLHQPFRHDDPPGMAGYWAGMTGRATPGYLQPVRVQLPGKGRVTFFAPDGTAQHTAAAPALARVGVGYVYRLRIDRMPDFPGVSLYPSVEIIDRLHPPAGQADRFPVPLEFTAEEIEQATLGRLVTKVVYLEQPQLASRLHSPLPVETLPPAQNLLHEADRRGRPMAIIRLGARQPAAAAGPEFFGRGGPMTFPKKQP